MIEATIDVIEEASAVSASSPSSCVLLASRQRRSAEICEAAPSDGINEQ